MVALASLPSTPAVAPASDSSLTGPGQLALIIVPLDATSENGGSPILQYEVQYDDGARGDYRSVYTLSPLVVVSTDIQRGLEYRARYRAMNFNGWGPYSAVAYIEAAGVPQKPPTPGYVSSTSTDIIIQLYPTADDGGTTISAYELWVDSVSLHPQT